MGDVRIGTSGWVYKEWVGPIFPKEVKAKERLSWISRRYATLEINASFYRMPNQGTVAGWREQTPDDFVFAWKASRFITHLKRLKEPEEPLAFMYGRVDGLGAKAGPILFQLPPNLKRDDERLDGLLRALNPGRRHAVEFRHPSWYDPAVFARLREANVALCLSDHHHAPAPFEVTADFVYLRGHGPGGRYFGRYPEETLADWAELIAGWRTDGDVFTYFDNDIGCAAPRDAGRLMALTSGFSGAPDALSSAP